MAVDLYKINFKSDFVLTISSDARWAVPFCVKFWTGMPSQAYFAGYDGTNYRNCRMGDTSDKLVVLFDDHHLPIGELKMQIAYHTTIEEFPTVVMDEVTNAQQVITEIDGQEYQVMLDFTGETAPEVQFSLPAYANEAQRIENELQRQQNELVREEYELLRQQAELQREAASAAAVAGAENVNAKLDGTLLTVTNRNGVSTTSNVQGPQGPPGRSEQSDWAQSDPAEPDYIKNKPSVYTQQQTNDLLSGKQNVITDLQEIRSGAQAGETAYQKPQTGIPAQDIAPGVIPDVSNFITKSVDDLANYYLKSETYTKAEVQTLINAVKQFTYEVVQTLPMATADTMHKIYLVPSSDPQTQNVKDEYITIDNGAGSQPRYTWEQIGSTAIDLSGYVTTTALNTALANYVLSTDLQAISNNDIDTIWNNVMS